MNWMARPFRVFGQFLWQLFVATMKHDILSLAATIAFYAFFSLFPLLVLLIYALSLLLPNAPVEKLLLDLVRPYFPALKEAQQFISFNLSQLGSVGSKLGVVSAIILTWSATSGFIAVQQALDVICESMQQRSYVVRRLIAFSMLFILLLASVGCTIVMTVYSAVSHSAAAPLAWLHWLNVAHGVSRILFPLSLFLVCLVFYRYLPSAPTPWSYLIPGALVATVAVDLGREMFVWYAQHLVTYQMIYGTLTVVMLVILWMYIASIAMLFGAEVAMTLKGIDGAESEAS